MYYSLSREKTRIAIVSDGERWGSRNVVCPTRPAQVIKSALLTPAQGNGARPPIGRALFESSLRCGAAVESIASAIGPAPPSPAARLSPGGRGNMRYVRPLGRTSSKRSLGRARAGKEAPQSEPAPLGAGAQLSRCGGFYLFRLGGEGTGERRGLRRQ